MLQSWFSPSQNLCTNTLSSFSFPLNLYPSLQNIIFSLPHSHFSALTAPKKEQSGNQLGKSVTPVNCLNRVLLAESTKEDELFAQKESTEKVREAAENSLDFVLSKLDGNCYADL